MKLSEHFTLEEFCFSETAMRLGLDNAPSIAVIKNLTLVGSLMERVRTLLGDRAIRVYSGYRSLEVNKVIGGVKTSAHCSGLACDFVCPDFGTPCDVALAIFKSEIDYDQLILEYGWVHIGLTSDGILFRKEALTKRSRVAPYEVGIRA